MRLPNIYVSTDIETDGWQVGQNSMLSFGSVAFFEDATIVDKFSANLDTLPEGTQGEENRKWWLTQPEAWAACRTDCQAPEIVMPAYARWLEALPGKIIFVAAPLVFDFSFVDYYLQRFVGHNPFGYATIDIRSFSMGLQGCRFQAASIRQLPKQWLVELPHTHIVLDDALEQGMIFCNLLAAANK